MSDSLERIGRVRMHGGWIDTYTHASEACDCTMRFGVFLPPQAQEGPVPSLYWLSGLTCTEENFLQKSGAQRWASELGIALVAPDTSPRGLDLPGEHDDWDFGSGAGFYVDATRRPWSQHYRMHDYVVRELPALIEGRLPLLPRRSVSGHSMGGHGAIVAALRNPGHFQSVSAFAPICAPTRCPWGEKAFSNYLGDDRESWKAYDSCELLREAERAPALLVDQGTEDGFLAEQLKPELLEEVCRERGHDLELRLREGYDHSYFFVASFFEEHLRFHAGALAT
ncbi:MAG: S-formylglutathione hydrolase [Acidobacteriota bacterium]